MPATPLYHTSQQICRLHTHCTHSWCGSLCVSMISLKPI